FFDRLRGKKVGVTAWTKFPLRMLSLQQLERIAIVFARAEVIRHEEKIEGDQFSVGYFVGKGNTPNKISDPYNAEDNIKLVNEVDNEKFMVIDKCPFCGNAVKLVGDSDTLRILHICTNKECPNPHKDNVIPVYITDNECYRYLPTFIISTLDKITIINTNKSFKQLYGQVRYKCPKHGYFFVKNFCLESSSKKDTDIPICEVDSSEFQEVGELKDPSPTLLIQDEMHLIREDFGTLDAHFETFLNYFQKQITGGKEIKVIAATATITNYERQIEQLYLKKGRSFPFSGHERGKSFYAEEIDQLHRLVCGIVPHDRAPIWATYSVIELYYKLIQDYLKEPQSVLDLNIGIDNIEDAKELIRIYRNILSYHLSRREADTLKQSIETQVNEQLESGNYKKINHRDITGDKSFKEVRHMLSLLSDKTISEEDRVDLIVATKMISHGVDLEDLNFMSFMGMPRNNSEYIQAMSRVGRAHPGIVFIVFNANRERDQSYYKYFEKFHDFKDLLVEAVPLTRWSKYSIQKTLPGLFSAAILNYFNATKEKELYGKGLRKLIVNPSNFMKAAVLGKEEDKAFTQEEIIEFLKNSLETSKDPLKPNFENEVSNNIPRYYEKIADRPRALFFPTALEKGNFKILRSLRDIGEQCMIRMGKDAYILENIKPDANIYESDKSEEKDADDGYEGESDVGND
ncbi:helicase-related protein, partial [Nanoarchaeota archaeon]